METENIQTKNIEDKQTDWMEEELKECNNNNFDGEMLPGLTIEENKLTEFDIDFSKPFEKWVDPKTQTIKKLIPITHAGEKKIFWLNVKNPTYAEILKRGKAGQTKFKIIRNGQMQNTRYNIVD